MKNIVAHRQLKFDNFSGRPFKELQLEVSMVDLATWDNALQPSAEDQLMLLNEIIVIANQPSDYIAYNDFPELQPFRTAKVETYPLWFAKKSEVILFSIKDGDVVIASIVAREITGFGDSRETIQIQRTWTDPRYRNKGFMTAMYNTLGNQGFRVISDLQLSPQSLAVWRKLGSRVKMFNFLTKQVEPISQEIWNEPENKAHLYFVLEHSLHPLAFNPCNRFVYEYHKFLGEDCP